MTTTGITGGPAPLPPESIGKLKKLDNENKVNDKGFISEEHAKEIGKELKKHELGKDGEISEKLKDLGKIGSVNKKLDIFGDDLKEAKSILSDMMAGSGNPAINHFKLDNLIDGLSKKELTEFAKHINSLMKNTDGQDDMLSNMLDRVLGEIGQRDNPKPPFHNDFEPLMKYNCSYSTKSLKI